MVNSEVTLNFAQVKKTNCSIHDKLPTEYKPLSQKHSN